VATSAGLKRQIAEFCARQQVSCQDLTGGTVDFLSRQSGVIPRSDHDLLHRVDSAYCDRINAMSYTLDHDDGLGREPAKRERECTGRRLVQPLRVVDDGEQRTLVGRLREQCQDGQSGEETIWRRTFAQAECNPQGVALRCGQSLHDMHQRRAQLVQGGVREFHL
jgi:hypothetical protein